MARLFDRVARACIALAVILSASPAFAGAPIPGVDVIVRRHPGSASTMQTKTDSSGRFTLTLAPGSYTIELSGPSVARTLGKGVSQNNAPRIEVVVVGYGSARRYNQPIIIKDAEGLRGGTPTLDYDVTIPAGAKAQPYIGQVSLAEPVQSGHGDPRWTPLVPKPTEARTSVNPQGTASSAGHQTAQIELNGALKQNPGYNLSVPGGRLTQNPGYLDVPNVGVSVIDARNGVIVVTTKRGNTHGRISLGNLPAGQYLLQIDGPSFATAIDALVPSPARRTRALSVDVGGHGKPPPPPQNPITSINISLPANPDLNTANWGTGTSLKAVEIPYSSSTARQGMRIAFSVPAGASRQVGVSIQLNPNDVDQDVRKPIIQR